MQKTLAIAAIAATAAAQCTVNPNFSDAIANSSPDTTYTYGAVGTAQPWGTSPGSVAGSNLYTGLEIGSVTLLAGFSSALDGNNGAENGGQLPGDAVDVINYESHSFTATDAGSCFNLADNGVTITDIDHDHDNDVNNDDYHDAVAVYFTLSDGSQVAGVPSTIAAGSYGASALTAAPNSVGGNSGGTVVGPSTFSGQALQYSANDVEFTDIDTCPDTSQALCSYSPDAPLYSTLFLAPVDSEVTGIEIRYFSIYPSSMPEDANTLNAAHVMAVGLLNQPPTCSASATCNGVSVEDILCPTEDDCECECLEFPECTPETASCNGDVIEGVMCTTLDPCVCECDEFPLCNTNGLTCEGEFTENVRCPDQNECECECVEFPLCADPASCDGTITQGVRCPDAAQCECECVVDTGCPVVQAECGAASASGSTTTEKCICLEFAEAEDETGGGDF